MELLSNREFCERRKELKKKQEKSNFQLFGGDIIDLDSIDFSEEKISNEELGELLDNNYKNFFIDQHCLIISFFIGFVIFVPLFLFAIAILICGISEKAIIATIFGAMGSASLLTMMINFIKALLQKYTMRESPRL